MLRPSRLALLHALLVLFAIALVGRAGQVQLWQRGLWEARSEAQHLKPVELPAPRGDIFDERGHPLAVTRPAVRLGVAPREILHADSAMRAMARMGVPADLMRRAVDTSNAWVQFPGLYAPARAAGFMAMRGVYAEPTLERVYTAREATQRVVGVVDGAGAPVDGLELALDTVLHGTPGRATLERLTRGGRFVLAGDTALPPRAGDVVVLTINESLQEIAQRALDSAVAASGASGGDLVVLDPDDGEIRAMASRRRDPRSAGSPALAEPFEPGSTLKPLIVASLLSAGRAQPDERMNTEGGKWTVAGRTITDEHPAPSLTLREVIRWSSNIGIVKFSSRLSSHEEYGVLRDFGFGTVTGVPFPSEASGTLRAPAAWSKQSPASLAMGYEVAVTPLQLAAAYVPIANGGELLEPALVKEIRAADGTVLYRHQRRVVRRVIDPASAAAVRAMMIDVVDLGTSQSAAIRGFQIAGKSGTSRRAAPGTHAGYTAGHYTASFVALFPAEHPQYVMLVKLDDPPRQYFGGRAAAPVSKLVIEAALASRDASLDRDALAAESLNSGEAGIAHRASFIANRADSDAVAMPDARSTMPDTAISFDIGSLVHPSVAGSSAHAVPAVKGLSIRAAVLALHRAGFRVQVGNVGASASGTVPAAGAALKSGAIVRVVSGP